MASQELLVFSAIVKLFTLGGINFRVQFLKKGISTNDINARSKRQLIQIWEVWKIYQLVPMTDLPKRFDIDGNTIQRFKKQINYNPIASEIFNRFGVTPFMQLDYVTNYTQNDIGTIVEPIYDLNAAIVLLLKEQHCYHPFASKALSGIITEELFLNFLDHSSKSSFKGLPNLAFMSISIQTKLDEKITTITNVQQIKKRNFEEELLPESKNFYYDSTRAVYKNFPYIQFSFLDFGEGIVHTLSEQFKAVNLKPESTPDDILRFAFGHTSSRHPINPKFDQENFIPRGLFDAISIVKRYRGLMIVRSNEARIIYDYSDLTHPVEGTAFSEDQDYNFPGTLISIYIPALEDTSRFNKAVIKPEINFFKIAGVQTRYLNINKIVDVYGEPKHNIYNKLFKNLRQVLKATQPTRHFLNCEGSNFIDKRLLKKVMFYLTADYDINYNNNVIIFGLDDDALVQEIENELLNLSSEIKDFKIHPLPIINYDYEKKAPSIKWLGVFNISDQEKLNDLLFEEFSLAKSDFKEPHNIVGHLNEFDAYGNLKSYFPDGALIDNFFLEQRNKLCADQINRLILKHNCLSECDDKSIFLCNGNYYQYKYVELTNLLNDKTDCGICARMLFNNLRLCFDISKCKFIGVTTKSQKILKSLEEQRLIATENFIIFDSYHSFETEGTWEIFNDTDFQYILICDVIATGYLTVRLNKKLSSLGTRLAGVAVLVDTINPGFSGSSIKGNALPSITSITKFEIERFLKDDVSIELQKREIIRTNIHTNVPITLSIDQTRYDNSILFDSNVRYNQQTQEIIVDNRFLDWVSPKDISVGYLKYNNVIHPYFFNTTGIFQRMDHYHFEEVFARLNKDYLYNTPIKLFYPRKSGVETVNLDKIKMALKNYNIEDIVVERIGTTEGWRFPHSSNFLSSKIDRNVCLILDDGSCTGDSLIQMVDEIAFYDAKEIIVLCVIGRLQDHKREFLSRLTQVKVKDGMTIPLTIYFATHWHIPTYYFDDNPNIRETHWLNEVIHLTNTPQYIKNIASNVLSEIRPKQWENFSDYKYLPKNRLKTSKLSLITGAASGGVTLPEMSELSITPKKDLLKIREELGKVTSYRLYKESFQFFNFFFKKYENKVLSQNRYREIELLCGTFIYEPYLFDKLSGLPDIVEQVKEFVRVLIFSDRRIYRLLTYEWDKKDIVHLFFIVFKDEQLFEELNKENNFSKLIAFTEPESALNYMLYKLLAYIPLKVQDFEEKKYDNLLKELIGRQLQRVSGPSKKSLKKYYNFLYTLPSREEYLPQLMKLRMNYQFNDDAGTHDSKKSFNHNVSALLAGIRAIIVQLGKKGAFDAVYMEEVFSSWFALLEYINPILAFARTFNGFLVPYPYFDLMNKAETGETSLRALVGVADGVIMSLSEKFKDSEKLSIVEKNIKIIQSGYFTDQSAFKKLIVSPIYNLKTFWEGLIDKLSIVSSKIKVTDTPINSNLQMTIPEYYAEQLLINELATNLKNHSDLSQTVMVESRFEKAEDFVLTITNKVSPAEYVKSNGEGVKCIRLMGAFLPFEFQYSSKKSNDNFIQKLVFKVA
ncbi:hypothetical protein [Mucilaginibacter defluvii]